MLKGKIYIKRVLLKVSKYALLAVLCYRKLGKLHDLAMTFLTVSVMLLVVLTFRRLSKKEPLVSKS